MLVHNISAAFRNLFRFKNQSAISLVGLVLGLACVYVISAWTIQELQYDRFHMQPENIYMVTTDIKDANGNSNTLPETPPPLAEALKASIPEIEHSFHFIYLYGGRLIHVEDQRFKETGIAADPDLFDVLNFQLIAGSLTALEEPNSILLTENLAKKLFPRQEPVGQSLVFGKDKALIVGGIIKDIPENSSLQFDYIIPYELPYGISQEWWQLSDATFIKTRAGADIEKTKRMAQEVFRKHITDDQYNLNLIPITKLRFGAKFDFFNAQHGSYTMLLVFIGIAGLILILACLNYINLVSANYIKRRDEVIIKKINGASIKSLIGYFISESIVLSIVAWLFSIPVSRIFIHFFESILEVEISIPYLYLSLVAGFFVSLFVVGIISGIYPAIMTSSIAPSITQSKTSNSHRSQGRWKNVFVLYQFVLSISLTIACLAIIKQTNYLKSFEVGYEKDNIIQIMLPREKVQEFQSLRNNLMANPNIIDICFAGASPVNLTPINSTENWTWKGLSEGTHTSIYPSYADHNYLKIFQIPLIEGRYFSSTGRDLDKVVINEKLAGLMGFPEPIGQILTRGENQYEIIGMVKDFHFQHLSNNIHPLMFMYSVSKPKMFVKTNNQSKQVLEQIQNIFLNFSDEPYNYDFVADQYDELYKDEFKLTIAILVFTILAIVLSCIGLIGLITFSTETRTKEIGIRKVCGASTREMLKLLNMSVIRWLLLGFVISCIIAWIGLNKWLESFANRIALDWWIFILGAFIILVLTALTVSLQTWRAATRNPAEALRSE